jgi:adenine-specific DNA-methyltransferase
MKDIVCLLTIYVQLPEPTDEKSGTYNAGYKNIAGIGKERIRRT